MYFRARDALNHDQLAGIDNETAVELCTLEFDDSKSLIVLQSKRDYKERFGKSPDFGDSGVMLVEVARRKGFRLAPIGQTMNRMEDWDAHVQATQEVFATADYSPEEDELEEVL